MTKKHLFFYFIPLLFVTKGYATNAQQPINLGETPWKFTKIIHKEINLAKDAQILYGTQVMSVINDGDINTEWKTEGTPDANWMVDLRDVEQLDKVKFVFKGDGTQFVNIQMEGSRDNEHWDSLSEATEKKACHLNKQGDITSTGSTGTVGYVETVINTSLSIPIKSSYRYIRFSIIGCSSKDGKKLPVSISELIIHPVEQQEHYSDGQLASLSHDDGKWETVGIPHCYNEQDTYLNASTGERCWRGEAWYRKKVFFDKKDQGKEMFLEFEGVNIGTVVYINGKAIPGNSNVAQPGIVTHVGSSLPFVINITPYIHWNADNQIAVKVSNAKGTFFTWPEFGVNEGF